jgi:predicted nucleic acid-binding protein
MFFLSLTDTLDLYVVSTCVLTEVFKVVQKSTTW